MVGSADLGNRNDRRGVRGLNGTRFRRVLLQSQMCPAAMIIVLKAAQVSVQTSFVEHDHVIQAFSMRYVEVAGNDLQREFCLGRSQPRHLTPQPKAPIITPRAGLHRVVDSLLFAQHAIEMFRRSLPDGAPRRCFDRLSNRLTKILSEARKLKPPG